MKVKVCGLSTIEQVETCINHDANFCGFILNYPKSHRHIEYNTADKLTKINKRNAKYVGVLVHPTYEELAKFSKLNIDYFQIYGEYTRDDIKNIKGKFNKKIIMALQIKSEEDVLKYKIYENEADILFDSSGLEKSLSWNFDWIKAVPIPKMIAGNIQIQDLEKISKMTDIVVDVSGAVETERKKDLTKIKEFLLKVKEVNENRTI